MPRLILAAVFLMCGVMNGSAFWAGSTSPVASPIPVPQGPRVETPIDPPVLVLSRVSNHFFARPTAIANAGDGSGRLFIAEQAGVIRVIREGAVPPKVFLDISDRSLPGPEQGLLGLAFSPAFRVNGRFYVCYTRRPDGAVVVSRFRLTDPAGAGALPDSEEILLEIPHPSRSHNGGHLAFGPDGYLYIGVGDGGMPGRPSTNAQTADVLLGKILRIDAEGGGVSYEVPADNPFVGRPGYAPEIWALGLRNPWRFSFDRLTGDLYLADVGEQAQEEINVQRAGSRGGENYGWSFREGDREFPTPHLGVPMPADLTDPVITYGHHLGRSVTGGYVYRGPDKPRMNGVYFYCDFISGQFWGSKQVGGQWESAMLLRTNISVTTFGENEQGELLVATYHSGQILQVRDSGQVATPRFVPFGGTISSSDVTLWCETPGALIHVRRDGADPTPLDPAVNSGETVVVFNGDVLRARAFRSDLLPSDVTEGRFLLKVSSPLTSPPSGPITNGTPVTLLCSTPNAVVRYTLDGSDPVETSPAYSEPLLLNGGTVLTARGFLPRFEPSDPVQVVFEWQRVATPEFSPFAGPITNGTRLGIACATPGAAVYYTVDGSEPTQQSPLYTGEFPVNGNTTVRAVAHLNAYAPSLEAGQFFELVTVALPEFAPPAGPITSGTPVTIRCATPGAVIRYTLDGSVPGPSSPEYTAPLVLSGNVTLSARGFRPEHNDSPVQSVRYALVVYEATVVWTLAGSGQPGSDNGLLGLASFRSPEAVWWDPERRELLVADTGNHSIRRVSPSGLVSVFAGTGAPGFQEGSAAEAQFNEPSGITGDASGQLFVADRNNSHRIRKIDGDGVVSTYATVRESYYGPGLSQVEMDGAGRLFVGNWSLVTLVTAREQGRVIAGSENSGEIYGWSAPIGLAVDAENRVLASTLNKIVRIVIDGPQEDFAGGGAGFADGQRLLAQFEMPRDLTVMPDGSVFVADATRVRRIGADGFVRTYAGAGIPGYRNGPGPSAMFQMATGVAVDPLGNLYVADTPNHCIRVVSKDADGDGIPDFKEGGPTPHVVGRDDRAEDADRDGMSNAAEFLAGTDPGNAASVLRIDGVSLPKGGGVEIRWQSAPGVSYLLESSEDLGTWVPVGGTIIASGESARGVDPAPADPRVRLYRVRLANLD